MHAPPLAGLTATVLIGALVLTGCADGADNSADGAATADDSASESTSPSRATRPPSASAGASSSPPATDDAVEIEVTIEEGQISPLGETVEATVGQEIRLEVDSDTVDELHVHSDPEHTFDVKARDGQTFTFSIDDPAVYEMESHEFGVVVAKLQISG